MQRLVLLLVILIAPALAHAGSDLSTPQAAARSYYDLLYSAEWPALEAITINDDTSVAFLKAYQGSIVTTQGFAAAVREKFGDDAVKSFVGSNERDNMLPALESATPVIDGNTATIECSPGKGMGKVKLVLRKIGDAWKYDATARNTPRTPDMTRMFADNAEMVRELTELLKAGKFSSVEELKAARSAMQKARRGNTPATTRPAGSKS